MNFSEQQTRVLQHGRSDKMGLVAVGAIRSGKTYATGLSFAAWCLTEAGTDHDHGLIGQTVDAAMRNMGFDLVDHLRAFGCPAYIDKKFGTRILLPLPGREASIWVWGGFDARARKRVQGATLKGLLVDEAALVPEDLFMMAWGRLSPEKSKFWANCNPETPTHWFKKKVIDRKEDFDTEVLNFKMSDNPGLSTEAVKRYTRAYSGHFHKRYIEGLWVGASGIIYPKWRTGNPPEKVRRYVMALDYGLAGVFTAIMFAEGKHNVTAVGELYYDARDRAPLTSDQLLTMLNEWRTHWLPMDQPMTIYMDPATPLEFKRKIRREGYIARNGQNTVLDGIITTGARLESGNLLIGDCPNLKEELYGYQWDSQATERGEEAPLKENDHACDALRYYAHTTGKLRRFL